MNGLSFSILIVTVSLHFCLQTSAISETTSLSFKSLSYETRIYEKALPGVEVATLQAYYLPIRSSYKKIEYKLAPFDDHQYFNIDYSSGIISTRRLIDRQIGEIYNITVLALSMSFNNRIMNTSMPLSIIVSAFNQYNPQILCKNYNLVIHNSTPIGSKLLKIKATDRDEVNYNSRIIYSLMPNSTYDSPFALNSTSGELVLTQKIPLKPKQYCLNVKAHDTGSPLRFSTAFVQIEIEASLSAPLIASTFIQETTARICWSMPSNESINGFLIKYKGEHESAPTTINITSRNKFECETLYEIEPNFNYSIQVYAWNKNGIGVPTDVQYFFARKNCECENSFCKLQSNGVCICPPGKCVKKCPLQCLNNSTCSNTFDTCICNHGFAGNLCQEKVKCKYERTKSPNGVFDWITTEYGESVTIPCPNMNSSYATRLCLLMANGSAIWDNIKDNCDIKTTTDASINALIKSFLNSEIKTKKKAQSILSIIDNNLSNFESDSYYDLTDEKIQSNVDKILSLVPLSSGEEFVVQHKNIAAKVIDVSNANRAEGISFEPKFEKPLNLSTSMTSSIKLPAEAFSRALDGTDLDKVRVQIVAYNSQKLFKVSQNEFSLNEMPVIQATIGNLSIKKLKESVVIVLQCLHCNFTNYAFAKCVFLDQNNRNWSTDGIKTHINLNNKSIICHSSHLTAFSVLFDITPFEQTVTTVILSTITYIGCYLSISGLFLTIITYSIFRCLNRDNSGKILLQLCISLLALNVSFIIGSQESIFGYNDPCALVAILIHYFVLTSLSWMCVEAIHIYQLLIHVFAIAETHYMLKRTTIAWGLPFIWVFITVFIEPEAYYNRNDYCMISPKFAYVYYISYLMPAMVIIIINFTVFVLATKVLFTPRMTTSMRTPCNSVVNMSQIRGAFTVMTLLGVGWIFGALALGDMKVIFQYIFSIANSLQGFCIFLIRCVQYPEARNAWIQLIKTGTFKKHRGQPQRLQGSWIANSNSNRLSSSDRKPSKETDSTFSMTANRNSNSSAKLSKPFLYSDDDCDVRHFTTYDSIRGVQTSSPTE